MKILGLIVEYNPFHNGHLFHIEEAKRITNAEKVVVVMSGDFVQRGAPAIMPKHLRAEMALKAGASLVLELPVRYATGSAEYFAQGAVSLLHNLGCIDCICFGSESGDLKALSLVADVLLAEPVAYTLKLQDYQKQGHSFPRSRYLAIKEYLMAQNYDTTICELLQEPNNILGVEYIKAIKKLKSSMLPFTITRKVSHYHDKELQENYSSASALRKVLYECPTNDATSPLTHQLAPQMPNLCYEIMEKNMRKRFPIYNDHFSLMLHTKLLSETKDTLVTYEDVTPELANRILNLRNDFINFDQFCDLVKSKNMTLARIRRACLHILLNIKKTDTAVFAPYARILGFRKSDDAILRLIEQYGTIPMITKISREYTLSEDGNRLLAEDIYASNLYETVVTNIYHTPFIHEYKKSLVLI